MKEQMRIEMPKAKADYVAAMTRRYVAGKSTEIRDMRIELVTAAVVPFLRFHVEMTDGDVVTIETREGVEQLQLANAISATVH